MQGTCFSQNVVLLNLNCRFLKFQITKLDFLDEPIRKVIRTDRCDVFNLPRRNLQFFLERFVWGQLLYAAKGLHLPPMSGSAVILYFAAKDPDLFAMSG